MTSTRSRVSVYLLIALAWMLTRAFPLSQCVPWSFWEAQEAQKLLEYGFFERQGAIINIHYMTGLVKNPWEFNYVNHPYPILWLETLVYSIGGAVGIIVFNSVLGLLTCMAVYPALRHFYSEKLSLAGALVFTILPTTIFYDVDPNVSGLGAMAWPFFIWLMGRDGRNGGKTAPWMLGLAVFLSGSINWFAYTIYPMLLLGAVALRWEKTSGLGWKPDRAVLMAIIVGGAMTAACFAAQIVYYTPDWSVVTDYARSQAGQAKGVSNATMIASIVLRCGLSVGPVAALCYFVAWWLALRRKEANWLVASALLYPVLFAAVAIALRRYFYREIHIYDYLGFPLSVLVVETLRIIQSRWWKGFVAAGLVATLAYPMVRASIPVVTNTTTQLSAMVRPLLPDRYTILATNLQPQKSPWRSWDVGGSLLMRVLVDNPVRENVTSRAKFEGLLNEFKSDELKVFYLWHPGLPIDDDLVALLRNEGKLHTHGFAVPEEPPALSARLRSIYWKITGRHQVQEAEAAGSTIEFASALFLLKRDASGNLSINFLP